MSHFIGTGERFQKWWGEESHPLLSLHGIFDAGWDVGFREANDKAVLREKLIFKELIKHFSQKTLDELVVEALKT